MVFSLLDSKVPFYLVLHLIKHGLHILFSTIQPNEPYQTCPKSPMNQLFLEPQRKYQMSKFPNLHHKNPNMCMRKLAKSKNVHAQSNKLALRTRTRPLSLLLTFLPFDLLFWSCQPTFTKIPASSSNIKKLKPLKWVPPKYCLGFYFILFIHHCNTVQDQHKTHQAHDKWAPLMADFPELR